MNEAARIALRVTGAIAGILLVAVLLAFGHTTAFASGYGTPATGDAIRENLPLILGIIAAAAIILIVALAKRRKGDQDDASDAEIDQKLANSKHAK